MSVGGSCCARSACGHLVGMLDRDQRTAKIRRDLSPPSSLSSAFTKLKSVVPSSLNGHRRQVQQRNSLLDSAATITHRLFPSSMSLPLPPPPRQRSRRHDTRNPNYLRQQQAVQRFGSALLISVYVLVLVARLPTGFAAPVPIMSSGARSHPEVEKLMAATPHWYDPCGYGANTEPRNGTVLHEIVDAIIMQAGIAKTHANSFKEKLAMDFFNEPFSQSHNNFMTRHLSFLSTKDRINKLLGEMVEDEHLQTLTLQESLLNAYEYLQYIAVGLEEMYWDQIRNHGKLVKEINATQSHLHLLLCEIQTVIMEEGIQMRPDVTRDVMGEELRNLSTTEGQMRDFIIYRDYMNSLEYVEQVFTHLKDAASV